MLGTPRPPSQPCPERVEGVPSMSDEQNTEQTEQVERIAFDYAGVTWRVCDPQDRPWEYVPTWNRGEWDKAIEMLLDKPQYKKFREVVRTQRQMNDWFGAYNEAVGGNS